MNSNLFVTINYKYNKYKVGVSIDGAKACDLVRAICARLGLNEHRHYLQGIEENALVNVWSEVTLCCYDDANPNASRATMQMVLWDIASSRSPQREDLFKIACKDLFGDIFAYLTTCCRYQLFEAFVEFPNHGSRPYHWVPHHWSQFVLEAFKDKGELNAILCLLEQKCNSEGMYPDVDHATCVWHFNWKGDKLMVPKMPLLNSRDIIGMGYSVRDQHLIANMMKQLQRAVNIGEVDQNSAMAQKEWIRKRFPNVDRIT